MKRNTVPVLGASAMLLFSGLMPAKAQESPTLEQPGQAAVEHSECSFFVQRDKFQSTGRNPVSRNQLSALTARVTGMMASSRMSSAPDRAAIKSFQDPSKLATIDKYLFAGMQANGVTPADKADDSTFIRRVTLDLTGRIPTPDRVLSFVADTSPTKRAALVDELLAKPEWVDKWTMYFGDLYNNTSRNTFVVRYEAGRNAFYKYIKDSLTANKPYNQIATELITAQGENTYTQGELNWIIGAWVIGSPQQDNIDQESANIADTFLGISHMNCLLCHNGRGHLDALSLWGSSMTRAQAWNFSSFMSHATTTRVPVPNAVNNQPYYWNIRDNQNNDYQLNTTVGNRPARQPLGTQKTMPPIYPFTGEKPAAGENYRVALARIITSDIQFSRATVNYMWAQFFGRGIVDPPNQFDPARLDPDNPPADPWTLQPSNARLLNAMAQEFVADGYDLKKLMRKIANSEAYQLSATYNGDWQDAWEPLFARKLVRRLWPEEIHDAVIQSSGMLPNNGAGYNLPNFSYFPDGSLFAGNPAYGTFLYAMQAPDVVSTPDNGGPVSQFMDAFFRGDRDLADRRADGSSLQALDLMNDPFITSRVDLTKAPKTGLLYRNLSAQPSDLVNNFFLNVLSRYPTPDEMKTALKQVPKGQAAAGVESLLWSLYNKVDFVFNY